MPRIVQPDKNIVDHSYVGENGEPCMFITGQDVVDSEYFYCEQYPDRHLYANPDEFAVGMLELPKPKTTIMPESGSEAVIAFVAYSEAVLALVRKKDAAYGGAWQEQGYMGNLARVLSKTARLKNMVWKDDHDGEAVSDNGESVLDTLKDLMALCAFMGANIEDGNRWGK